MPSYLRNFLVPMLLVGLYAITYSNLQDYRSQTAGNHQQTASSLWTLPPMALKVLAGEFKGLVADLITLEVGSLLGSQLVRTPDGKYQAIDKEYHWPTIHNLFINSQALDPSFQQTYMLAQGWLPWDAKMLDETQAILRTASINRPWDWHPLHFIGFNTYYFLNDPGDAGKIFIEAAKIPNAPPFLAILGARFAQKGGKTETAITLMKSMLTSREENMEGYDDIFDRLKALEGVLVLEKAVTRYQELTGAIPENPEALVSSGILATLPDNPYHLPYCIDSAGKVYFDNLDCKSAN